MLHVTLWGNDSRGWSGIQADERLRQNTTVLDDLRAILDYRLQHSPTQHAGRVPEIAGPLTIHARYTRTKFSSASDTGPSTVVLTSVRESCTSRHPKSMLSS